MSKRRPLDVIEAQRASQLCAISVSGERHQASRGVSSELLPVHSGGNAKDRTRFRTTEDSSPDELERAQGADGS